MGKLCTGFLFWRGALSCIIAVGTISADLGGGVSHSRSGISTPARARILARTQAQPHIPSDADVPGGWVPFAPSHGTRLARCCCLVCHIRARQPITRPASPTCHQPARAPDALSRPSLPPPPPPPPTPPGPSTPLAVPLAVLWSLRPSAEAGIMNNNSE